MIEWNPKAQVIARLIDVLYDLDGCGCGGLCHIVTDDQNLYDDNLQFVIRECHNPENDNRVEKELCSLICELLLQLSFEQRAIIFLLIDYYGYNCVDEDIWNDYQKHNNAELEIKTYKYRDEDYENI